MTNINQSIIDDAKTVGAVKTNAHSEIGMTAHDEVLTFTYDELAKFAELTLKRNGGEAVYQVLAETHQVQWIDCDKETYDKKLANQCKRIVYLSPPQPQTVADALEKVAKICDEWVLASADDEFGLGQKFTSKNIAEKIRALITNPTQEAQGWISVEDRLPVAGEWYLIFIKDKFSTMAFLDTYHETGETVWLPHNNNAQQEVENVTHWMPLPTAPNSNTRLPSDKSKGE